MVRRGAVASLLMIVFSASASAQRPREGWSLGLGASRLSLGNAARDTLLAPGVDARLRPSDRFGFEAQLALRRTAWEASLGIGYAGGHIRAESDALVSEDKTSKSNRYRLAVLVGRRLAVVGRNDLMVAAGPTLDRWTLSFGDSKTALGALIQVGLRIPAGRLELENLLSVGWSGGPFRPEDLPSTAETRTFRVVSFGGGIRFRL